MGRLPLPARSLIIPVVVLTHVGVGAGLLLSSSTVDRGVLAIGALLVAASILHGEIVIGVARFRKRTDHGSRTTAQTSTDLTSVWTFAMCLLLPPALVGAFAFACLAHFGLRVQRSYSITYRVAFTQSTLLLSCVAGSATLAALGVNVADGTGSIVDMAAVVLAALVYTAINTGLLVWAVVLANPGLSLIFNL